MRADVIIIGAGAAGLMAAMTAGKRGRSVLVLDHAGKAGRKIRIAGGGRCNFTNINAGAGHYISANPHFCKSALAQFSPSDFIALVEQHRIPYEERKEGQLFCVRSSADIMRMLEQECRDAGAVIHLGCTLHGVERRDAFAVTTSKGTFRSSSVIVATGGLSYPNIGASGLGHAIARRFGLAVTELHPALVPLVFSRKDQRIFGELAGISFPAAVSCKERTFRENILFTHKGLSGPAILQISSYWNRGDLLSIDLLPDVDTRAVLTARRQSRAVLATLLSSSLPRRFAHTWCSLHGWERPMAAYSAKELDAIAQRLHAWELYPAGTEGYATAEVTRGGVDTAELSSKTMEARKVPGLYFAGEVVDVTGQLGGYNLQWAWSSGYAAGRSA